MLQHALDIPRPLSADNETVITALETAALFGSKGDAQEAMRWLRRAAESAGEAGDDVRALALSRTAADLSEELKRDKIATPTPPPLPSAPPSVPRPSAAPPSVRASAPPPLPSAPVAAAADSTPVAAPPRPSLPASPAPPSVRSSTPPASARASAPPPSVRSSYPTPPSSRPDSHFVAPSRPSAAPAATTAAASGPPKATRVSIQRSPTVPGVFEVRLLADGESARSGDGEAFLVMVDPQSTLLSS